MQLHAAIPNPRHASLLALLACVAGCASTYENGAPVTPQRPSFAADPSTTAAGTFELEVGETVDPGNSFSTPVTLKYGAGETTEVFVGFSPFDHVSQPGKDGYGLGDTLFGVRNRFWESEEGTSAAFQFVTKLPTADDGEGLGSGELDFFASAMVSHPVSNETGLLAYYEYGVLGDPASPSTDSQHLLAIAASHSLQEKVGIYAELASFFGTDGGAPLITTLGATYLVASSFVLDVGASFGLNGDAADFQLLFGLTVNFGGPGH